MQLKDLKNWMDSLPEEFLDFNLVVGQCGEFEGEFYFRKDVPVTALSVDESDSEVLIMIDTQFSEEEIRKFVDVNKSDE